MYPAIDILLLAMTGYLKWYFAQFYRFAKYDAFYEHFLTEKFRRIDTFWSMERCIRKLHGIRCAKYDNNTESLQEDTCNLYIPQVQFEGEQYERKLFKHK